MIGWKERKKILCQIPFKPDPGIKIPKKIPKTRAKKLKKIKNLFLAMFIAKTGCDKLNKGEKTFSVKFRSYSIRGLKFKENSEENSKKFPKLKKPLFGIISSQIGM